VVDVDSDLGDQFGRDAWAVLLEVAHPVRRRVGFASTMTEHENCTGGSDRVGDRLPVLQTVILVGPGWIAGVMPDLVKSPAGIRGNDRVGGSPGVASVAYMSLSWNAMTATTFLLRMSSVIVGISSPGASVRRVCVAVSVHHGVGFPDRSAFIAMVGQLLIGHRQPQPLFRITQALVVSVDVFSGPGHQFTA
jgi:hypothetical protein